MHAAPQQDVSGSLETVSGLLAEAPGRIVGTGKAGWLLKHETNNSFILTNRLLKAGIPVSWLTAATKTRGASMGPGAIWVPASAQAAEIVRASVKPLGIEAYAVASRPAAPQIALKPVRIGLVDRYGGSVPAGWTRWLLEKYEFSYSVVFPHELDRGNLNAKYDVLLFADDTAPLEGGAERRGEAHNDQPAPQAIPAQYRDRLGSVTAAATLPQVKAFASAGGTVVTVGAATRLTTMLAPTIEPALAERQADGSYKAWDKKDFFIPGSIVSARVDPRSPLGYGMADHADFFFNNSPTFRLKTQGSATQVAWFDMKAPLRSGWAMGQDKLAGTAAIVEVDLDRGKLIAIGPEVTQRAQSYGTFKLLFNGLLYGPATAK